MIWITADTHFGHENIIKHSKRPFRNVQEMDTVIIDNINQTVKKDDILYHLGDWSWRNWEKYRKAIHCNRIHLIIGNHDKELRSRSMRDHLVQYSWFESVDDLLEIKLHNSHEVTLCHYAMKVWNKSHHGAWHLYGHSHGSLPDDPNSLSFDIGVDCHNYFPLNVEQISEIMSKKKFVPIDHHGSSTNSNQVTRY